MKTSFAVASAVAVLISLSILAVPAVASGADYLAEASTSTQPDAASQSSGSNASVTASRDNDLVPLITAWGASGAILLGGGALAVAASVRRQRKLPM
jgi:hypothetical protein